MEGITAVNASGMVSLTRNSEDYTITASTDGGATHIHNRMPVQSYRTGAPECWLPPTRQKSISLRHGKTVGPSPSYRSSNTMTWGRYGIPGVTATSALGVVTVVPIDDTGATVLQSVTGTAAGDWAVAYTTLTGLELDGAATVDAAANSTTNGKLYEQSMNGWEYGYLQLTNKSGAGAMTATVAATPHY